MSIGLWPKAGTTYLAEDLATVITSAGVSLVRLTDYYASAVRNGFLCTEDPTASGVAPTIFPPTNTINIKAYGAAGDGVTDDWTALTAAVAYARVAKCSIFFPPGTYRIGQSLDLSGAQAVSFVGDTALNSGGFGGSTLLFTQSSGTAIDCAGAYGITFRKLNLLAQASSGIFNGTLLSFDSLFSTPGGFHTVDGCVLSCVGRQGVLLSTNNTFNCSVKDLLWGPCSIAVKGPVGGSDFANSYNFVNCANGLGNCADDVYLNPGQGWSWTGCSFEPILSGVANGIRCDGTHIGIGLSMTGCWLGDSSGVGSWLSGAFEGLNAQGNQFTGGAQTVAFAFAAGTIGVSITGNAFSYIKYAYTFGTGWASNVHCRANVYTSLAGDGSGGYNNHIYSGTPTSGSVEDTVTFGTFAGGQEAKFTRCRARATVAAQSIPNNAITKLTSYTEDYDPNNNFGNNPGEYTVPFTGYYQVNAFIQLVIATDTWVEGYVFVNGSPVGRGPRGALGGGAGSAGSTISDILHLTIGDTVDFRCYQNSGFAATIYLGTFSIHYLSS